MSPNLSLGSKAEVTNTETSTKAEVEITDRGPYAQGRALDLSQGAAKELGHEQGNRPVRIELKSAPKLPRHVRRKTGRIPKKPSQGGLDARRQDLSGYRTQGRIAPAVGFGAWKVRN